MKASNAIWLFLQKLWKKYFLLSSPSQPSILLEYGVVHKKEQTK